VAETWVVEVRRGTAQELHDLEPPEPVRPTMWVCVPTRRAVVRGSTQRHLELDAAALARSELDVATRRSGGGLVFVDPEATVWIDLVVPRGHHLWHDDVGVAMHWVGETWVRALASLGMTARVHTGALRRGRWGALVCAASLGPGEVLDAEGRKLVGISQRRTRGWARFQCIAALGPDPVDLPALVGLDTVEAAALRTELARTTAPLPLARPVVVDAFRAALPV
jgi:lipoate-protein ligase A